MENPNEVLSVFKPLNLSDRELQECVMEASSYYLRQSVDRASDVIDSSEAMKKWLCSEIGTDQDEKFLALLLDNRHRVITMKKLFQGTVDFTPIFPRVIAKEALAHNAAAIVIAHNHPSGLVDPSKADKDMTSTIKRAMSLIDVCVLDHIIVAGPHSLSFAEEGLM